MLIDIQQQISSAKHMLGLGEIRPQRPISHSANGVMAPKYRQVLPDIQPDFTDEIYKVKAWLYFYINLNACFCVYMNLTAHLILLLNVKLVFIYTSTLE